MLEDSGRRHVDPTTVLEISSLPSVHDRIMRALNDQRSGAADLESAISSDPPLAMRTLRLANSPYYTVGRRIDSIRAAVLILGFEAIRSLALAATVARLFHRRFEHPVYCRQDLWHHSAAVGVCCRMIAKRLGVPEIDTAFVCGLVHDIGVVIEDQYHHDAFVHALDRVARMRCRLTDAELYVFDADHTRTGAALARQWQLSPSVRSSIAWHHTPEMCTDTDVLALVAVLHLSDLLCRMKFQDRTGDVDAPQLSKSVLRTLNITGKDVQVFYQDLDQELNGEAPLFELVG